jgi:hypothetical protein
MSAGVERLASCDIHTEFTKEQRTGHMGMPRWGAAVVTDRRCYR